MDAYLLLFTRHVGAFQTRIGTKLRLPHSILDTTVLLSLCFRRPLIQSQLKTVHPVATRSIFDSRNGICSCASARCILQPAVIVEGCRPRQYTAAGARGATHGMQGCMQVARTMLCSEEGSRNSWPWRQSSIRGMELHLCAARQLRQSLQTYPRSLQKKRFREEHTGRCGRWTIILCNTAVSRRINGGRARAERLPWIVQPHYLCKGWFG